MVALKVEAKRIIVIKINLEQHMAFTRDSTGIVTKYPLVVLLVLNFKEHMDLVNMPVMLDLGLHRQREENLLWKFNKTLILLDLINLLVEHQLNLAKMQCASNLIDNSGLMYFQLCLTITMYFSIKIKVKQRNHQSKDSSLTEL